MKTYLRKALAMVLCLMLCLSATVLFAGAEDATDDSTAGTPTFAKTVYLSSTGNDENDGLTKETAVKSIEVAAEKLDTLGGEIIVLDDITIQNPKSGEYLVYFSTNYSTVYMHGEKKADGTYPKLKYEMNKQTLRWEMASPFALYDIQLETDLGKAFVFVANGYPLTIGENVTCVNSGTAAEATAGTHSKFMIFGGQFNANTSLKLSTQTNPAVSVMSGTWAEVWADGNAVASVQDPVLNFLGGIGYNVNSCHSDKETKGTVTANIWGGHIVKLTGAASKDAEKNKITHVLNLYNGAESEVENMLREYASGGTATVSKLTGTAPTFFELAECKLEPPAPPVFDNPIEEGGDNNNDNNNSDQNNDKEKDTQKVSSNTNKPADNTDQGKKGCGSSIGTSGILVMAALIGTAVAVCAKKKEQ